MGGKAPIMASSPIRSPEDLAVELGERVRDLRLSQSYTQQSLADKAGIGLRPLKDLEAGRGSRVLTLIKVLKALGAEDGIETLAPRPTISPMDLLTRPRGRSRGNR